MNNWSWMVLSWNVHSINSDKKWNSIRDWITESFWYIICPQETKRDRFDLLFILNFFPLAFDYFDFIALCGCLRWFPLLFGKVFFQGDIRVFQNNYAASIEFCSLHNVAVWVLTNVYAPCTPAAKEFSSLKNIQMPDSVDLLLVGNFNLNRNSEDPNKSGADYAEINLLFNDAISYLGLVELPI